MYGNSSNRSVTMCSGMVIIFSMQGTGDGDHRHLGELRIVARHNHGNTELAEVAT